LLDPKLSPATQAAARASATVSVVGLMKHLSNTVQHESPEVSLGGGF
jgi:hypothetical protein